MFPFSLSPKIAIAALALTISTLAVVFIFVLKPFSQPPAPEDLQPIDLSADDDNDGLTNGQEQNFKTDPNKADTDGDGFSDYDEIIKGEDPTKPGSQKISENTALKDNLTAQFYLWRQENSSTTNMFLSKEEIDLFLAENKIDHIKIIPLTADEIGLSVQDKKPSSEELGQHVEKRYYSPMEENILTYIFDATELLRTSDMNIFSLQLLSLNNQYNLDQMITSAQTKYDLLKDTPTYSSLSSEQLADISYIKALHDILVEINNNPNDTVLLVKNIEWAKELLDTHTSIYDYFYIPTSINADTH